MIFDFNKNIKVFTIVLLSLIAGCTEPIAPNVTPNPNPTPKPVPKPEPEPEVEVINWHQGDREKELEQKRLDNLIKISTGTASSVENSNPVDKSYDGITTGNEHYHSKWYVKHLPITLTYNLEKEENVASMIYYPRKDGNTNGNFQEVDIYYSENGTDNFQLLQSHTFDGTNANQFVPFKNIVKAKAMRLIVKTGVGGFASATEIEFYRKDYNPNSIKEDIEEAVKTLFVDKIASKLKANVRKKDALAVKDPIIGQLALDMLENKYDTEYRVGTYNVYPEPMIEARILKTNPFSLNDNPTGIYVEEGDNILILSDDLSPNAKVSICIQDLDEENGRGFNRSSIFPIKSGINKINIDKKGLIYIRYISNDKNIIPNLKPVSLHFINGKVNGYYDYQNPKHRGRWNEILANAKYKYLDVIGKYSHMTYETKDFRNYTKNIDRLVEITDRVVDSEMDHIGLTKYKQRRNNRLYMHVVYGNAYMYATYYRTAYGRNTMSTLASEEQLGRSLWGPAHEIGHMNQTEGLKWIGMTEVTVNISSFHIVYNVFKQKTRMITENRYLNAWNKMLKYNIEYNNSTNDIIVKATQAHANPGKGGNLAVNVFDRLVPFIQLELYYGAVKGLTPTKQHDKGGFYPDIYEYLRKNQSGNDGAQQSEFPYIASKIANEDLTSFFEKWGFLTPVDMRVNDYATRQLTISQERINDVKSRISAMKLPKQDMAIEYITEDNVDIFRNRQVVLQGDKVTLEQKGNKLKLTAQNWQNVIAFEIVKDNNVVAILYGRNEQEMNVGYSIPGVDKILAVEYSGRRINVPFEFQKK